MNARSFQPPRLWWLAAGFGVWWWNGTQWISFTGSAVRIAVAPTGVPWVVNSLNAIYAG